jgi:hypothetical protein
MRSKNKKLTVKTTFFDFRYLLGKSTFLYFSGVSSIQAAFFFSMAGFMPYQFERLGASPTEFGFWFSLTSIGYITGNILNKRYSKRLGMGKFSLLGCSWCFLSISFMFLSEVPSISSPFTLASASGFLGALQMLCGALLGSLIVLVGGDQQFWLALIILLCLSIFSILCCYRANLLEEHPGAPKF